VVCRVTTKAYARRAYAILATSNKFNAPPNLEVKVFGVMPNMAYHNRVLT
jgi:hypothetical protein